MQSNHEKEQSVRELASLHRMKKNKLKEFNQLYSGYYRKCFLFAKSYVHNTEIADEIASEAMVKLWEIFGEEDIRNISAFLLTVVKNDAFNYLKREQLRLRTHENIQSSILRELEFRISTLESCDPELLFSDELKQLFEKTLASMPEQTRTIFSMSRLEDKSHKEIALLTGITVKGVDYHIAKAMKILREGLKDYLPTLIFLLY